MIPTYIVALLADLAFLLWLASGLAFNWFEDFLGSSETKGAFYESESGS